MTLETLLSSIAPQGGFLTDETLPTLAMLDPMRRVLVRCNGCRFWCPASQAQHMVHVVEASGEEWVRDISLMAGDPAFSGDYSAVSQPTGVQREVALLFGARERAAQLVAKSNNWPVLTRVEYGDGPSDADPGL